MDPATLSNLGAYAIQVACIAGAAALAAWLFNPGAPGARYAFWRIVTLASLTLPWLQGRLAPAAATPATASTATVTTSLAAAVPSSGTGAAATQMDWVAAAPWIFAAGIVLRLAWMAAGMLQLRRLRSRGAPAPACEAMDGVQRVIGAKADIRYIDGLVQPVTFGLRRPVVLLPSALRDQPDEIQAAVLGHELLHVQRRDWAWVIAEEILRTVLWFHPAVWWMVSRIQLAREEVVDELAVLATGRRRTYVEALLAFADEWPLALAPAFSRRRHLFRRVTLLSREVVMSSKRVVAYCAAMALVVALGGWGAVQAFPLRGQNVSVAAAGLAAIDQKPGPLESVANPISPQNLVPKRIAHVPATYPAEAAALQASGTVTLRITLDEGGGVAETRAIGLSLSGPGYRISSGAGDTDMMTFVGRVERSSIVSAPGKSIDTSAVARAMVAFRDSALEAVRQWRYEPPANPPVSFTIVVSFRAAETSAAVAPPPPPPPPPSQPATATRPGIQPPPPPPPPAGGVQGGVVGGVPGGVTGGVQGGITAGVQGGVTGEGALRVGGTIKPPIKVKDVRPVYPADAQQAKVQGVVILEARIEADGHVSDARVLRSVQLLDQAAIDAVMQWEFRPTLLNGVATPVVMTVTVNFTLQERRAAPPPPPPPPPPAPINASGALRVGGNIKTPVKVKDVRPLYPADAQAAGVQGVVIVEARIEADGRVSEARVVRSVPMLDQAAIDAVMQWEFVPTLLNGVPTPVIMTMTVNFTLQ